MLHVLLLVVCGVSDMIVEKDVSVNREEMKVGERPHGAGIQGLSLYAF